jgi:hypothetical protein
MPYKLSILLQIADDDPDDFAGADEFLRGAAKLRFGQRAHIRRVFRPVIGGQTQIDLIDRRRFERRKRFESAGRREVILRIMLVNSSPPIGRFPAISLISLTTSSLILWFCRFAPARRRRNVRCPRTAVSCPLVP